MTLTGTSIPSDRRRRVVRETSAASFGGFELDIMAKRKRSEETELGEATERKTPNEKLSTKKKRVSDSNAPISDTPKNKKKDKTKSAEKSGKKSSKKGPGSSKKKYQESSSH